MIKNYLKIAFRTILKQKFYVGINIIGLAVGLASCLVITLYVLDQLSFDKFHYDAHRVYKVGAAGNIGGEDFVGEGTAPPVAETLMREIPEVEIATRIYPVSKSVVSYNDKKFIEEQIIGVDSNFFKIFNFVLKEGNAAEAFKKPNKVILTSSVARKYFGNAPALGKTVSIGANPIPFEVVGVAEDVPRNSQLSFSILSSISSYEDVWRFEWSWVWSGVVTYIKVTENASSQEIESKFPSIIKKHAGGTITRIFGISLEEFEKNGGGLKLFLQPLTDVYLHSEQIEGAFIKKGNIQYLHVFIIIAIFIILLASVNFMNLSTARSVGRSKEVGIRKILGTSRRRLIAQFLSEAILATTIAMLLAVGIAQIFLFYFSNFLFGRLSFDLLGNPWLLVGLFGLVLIVGIIAGSYPAFHLSSFKPVEVLKSKTGAQFRGKNVRSMLVVFQFAVSVSLIIGTMLVTRQVEFLRTMNLGLNKENVMVLSLENNTGLFPSLFKNSLSNLAVVESSSIVTGGPAITTEMELFVPEDHNAENDLLIDNFFADYDYIETMQIQLIKGRNFSRKFPSDADPEKGAVLINESAARMLGWQDPIGKHLVGKDDGKYREIVGVVKDFNFESLHKVVKPLVIRFSEKGSYMFLRLREGDWQAKLKMVENEWKKSNPTVPFEFSFLDENIDALYHSEERLSKIVWIFSGLAIFIACLGLFGLVSFMAEQRTKEIGIRKVLGASVSGIVGLLSKQLMQLVIVSNLFAWPVAWYMINKWLSSFAYQVSIPWWIFIAAGAVTILGALVTVSFQSVKAALTNPTESLRNE